MQQVHGPLTTPKAFRRNTGAHTILTSLLLADLAGVLIWIVIGMLIVAPIAWILHVLAYLVHASLVLDIGSIIILLCIANGLQRRHLLKKNADDAWEKSATLILLACAVLVLLFFFKKDWLMIPATAIPAVPLQSFPWPLPLSPIGAGIAVGLSLLAHLGVYRRSQKEPDEQQRSFSRAHPDGSLWELIEKAYALFRRNLARFDPPFIAHLKTPPTFYYYQRQTKPDEHANPEQEMYYVNGNLILNEAYIGLTAEQSDILLPILARLLYNYNSPDALVERLFELARIGEASWFSAWMLTLPLSIAQHHQERWNALEKEHVLDRDRFANDCGEGKRLRKLLQNQRKWLNENNLPDNTIPTLIERIDHLDSLIIREARQFQKLREALPTETDNGHA